MRVALPTDFAARLSSASKDARMINGLSEEKSSGLVVLNRPGLVDTGYDYATGQGLLGLNGLLYLVYGDKFELSAYTGTPLPAYIHIGDLVGGYYAMIDNPPTSPGSGDAYWSASAPGAARYKSVIYPDPAVGIPIAMESSGTSPWIQSQLQGPVAASEAATIKKLQSDVSAAGGVIWWDDDIVGTPPHNPGATYRIIPTGMNSGSLTGYNWSCTDYSYGLATNRNWSAGYATSEIPAVSTTLGFGGTGAKVYQQQTSTGVTITSSGSVAQITLSALTSFSGSQLPQLLRYIEVSGANEPEYNGIFEFDLSLNPLDSLPSLTYNKLYYTMSGTPATSPATGTITIKHYLPV